MSGNTETKFEKEFEVHPILQFLDDKYGAYRRWIESEGIPVLSGSYVADVRSVELGEWNRKGGKGAYLRFSDQLVDDAYVCEIAPASSLKPQRHLYEEMVLIADGRGATTVWYDGTPKRTFEWEKGSLFSVPLNAWYQHFNSSGSEPARLFALTSAPPVIELYRDLDFIFNTNRIFRDRFDPSQEDFFARPGKYHTEYYGGVLHSNFIRNIREIRLVPRARKGGDNKNMYIHMAGGTMFSHVSEFPVGTYTKAHRHGPGAHIYILEPTGYTLMWHEGESPKRYEWYEGSVISPPAGFWHQHFNTGRRPSRYVALHASRAIERYEGGIDQIEFENEDKGVRKLFAEECAKNGITVNM
jgi:quercetin dioxygenase-like cupin family protein